MGKEMQKVEPSSPNEIIRLAIENKSDLDQVEKLIGLKIRYETDEARKDFASAFSVAQANISAVIKTKDNPQTRSKYAGLEDVIETSKPVYVASGFSVIFYEGKSDVEDNIRVCADVLHKKGHKETYYLDVPMGGVGIQGKVNMTKIHAKATSITYGRRYLLCMIWNIPTQDDDGNGDKKPKSEKREPNDHETDVLNAISKELQTKLSEGKEVDFDKLAAVFYRPRQEYPTHMERVPYAVKHILGLTNESLWTKERESRPEIPKPDAKQLEFIKAVHEKLAAPEGMIIVWDTLAKVIYAMNNNEYPTDKRYSGVVAARVDSEGVEKVCVTE